MAATLHFDVAVVITPSFTFAHSTIWPAVNKLASEIEAIDAAADAAIASLESLKGKST